jgi:transcriptional regulator with XRE-family HTH domain
VTQTASFTGRDLAAERVRADLRQRDLALRLGISRQRINQIERSARPSRLAIERYLWAVSVESIGLVRPGARCDFGNGRPS